MKGTVRAVPQGYHTVTPYLAVSDAAAALKFYESAFDAKEIFRLRSKNGRIVHAEMSLGDSKLMLAEQSALSILDLPGHSVALLRVYFSTWKTLMLLLTAQRKPARKQRW